MVDHDVPWVVQPFEDVRLWESLVLASVANSSDPRQNLQQCMEGRIIPGLREARREDPGVSPFEARDKYAQVDSWHDCDLRCRRV